jgi:ATP/maltotriose-dependent transcriptional regulator MalT
MERLSPVQEALTAVRDRARDGALRTCSRAAMQRLCDAADKPLAVVAAPAGYGKSTLLRAFAAARSAVFVDLAAGEATFRDAVRLICEGLRDLAPGARLAFASAYTRAAERGQRTTSLARWLARYLQDAGLTVVVDAVDRLGEETRAFSDFAEALVRSAPACHLVIGARDDTDLPVPRWFADDLTTMPVGADDLRWTVVEARSAAVQSALPHDAASLHRIVHAVNGRAFDVIYAMHAGLIAPADEDPGATLLRSIAADERAYVLETCLLRQIDVQVLGAAGLARHPLLGGGSYLGPLIVNEHDGVYRYDESLRLHAEAVLRADPAAYRRVALRIVDALEAVGRVRAALDLARTAALPERVLGLVRSHGLELEDRGDVDAVDSALDALPDGSDDAVILLLRASRESRQGRTDTSEAWYRHAIARAESRPVAAEAAYRLARDIVRRERSDAVEVLEPYATDETLDASQRCAIGSVLAEAYLVADRADDARAALQTALACANELDVAARAHLFTRASYIELYAGDHARARQYATTGAALAEEAGLYVVAIGSYSVLYNVAYDEVGPSEARIYLERLAECSVRAGNVDFHLYALIAAYELHVESGDLAAIERLEGDLREFDLHYGAASALQGLLPSRALVAAWKGDFSAAYDLLAASASQQQRDPDREALRWAEIALYAAGAGMPATAREALRSFEIAFASDGGASQHAVRGSILARLAAALIGAPPVEPRVDPSSTGRMAALARAAEVVGKRRAGTASANRLLVALEDLRRHEHAGMAKLFAALPAAVG